jgi:hypothetical protein
MRRPLTKLRFRYRPSKRGRAFAYAVVLAGFVLWMISGAWENPATQGNAPAIPLWTLTIAGVAYFVVSFLEKFGFEEVDIRDDDD